MQIVPQLTLWFVASALAIAEPSVDALIAVLQGPDPVASAAAARKLPVTGEGSETAIRALVSALKDERESETRTILIPAPRATVATEAAIALEKAGRPAVTELSRFLDVASDEATKLRVIRILEAIGSDAGASVPALERQLKDTSNWVRADAAAALGAVQADGKKLVQALVPVLSDKSPDVRAAAIRSLARPDAGGAVSHLIPLLDDRDERWYHYAPDMAGTLPVKLDTVQTLSRIGTDSRAALPKLSRMMLDDEEPKVRVWAAAAVCRLSDDPADALKTLVRALERERGETLEQATHAIREVGPRARDALPAVTAVLKRRNTLARLGAMEAIVAIDPRNQGDAILPLVSDSNSMVRRAAIEALNSLRITHDRAVTAYIAALDDKDDVFSDGVRHAAAVALGNLGSTASRAVAKLKDVQLADESAWVKEAAAKAIMRITSN